MSVFARRIVGNRRTPYGLVAKSPTESATMTYAKPCKPSPVIMRDPRPKRSIMQKVKPEEIIYNVALTPVRIRAKSVLKPRIFVRMIGK